LENSFELFSKIDNCERSISFANCMLYNHKVQSTGTFQIYIRKYLRNTSIIDREREAQLPKKLFQREPRTSIRYSRSIKKCNFNLFAHICYFNLSLLISWEQISDRKYKNAFTRKQIFSQSWKRSTGTRSARLSIDEESALCRLLLCRWPPSVGTIGVGGRKWFFVLVPLGPRAVESQEGKYMPARLAWFCLCLCVR